MLSGNNGGGRGGFMGAFYLVLISEITDYFNFVRGLVKEGNRGIAIAPSWSPVFQKTMLMLGVGTHTYCLNNVSLESCLLMDVWC